MEMCRGKKLPQSKENGVQRQHTGSEKMFANLTSEKKVMVQNM